MCSYALTKTIQESTTEYIKYEARRKISHVCHCELIQGNGKQSLRRNTNQSFCFHNTAPKTKAWVRVSPTEFHGV